MQKNILFSKELIASFDCEDNKTEEAIFTTKVSSFILFDLVSSLYEERVNCRVGNSGTLKTPSSLAWCNFLMPIYPNVRFEAFDSDLVQLPENVINDSNAEFSTSNSLSPQYPIH